jgi:hypothetical protein
MISKVQNYNIAVLGVITELKHLIENAKETIRGINRKRCVNECMIRAITRWIIAKTMVDEYKRSKLPKKSDKSENVKLEQLNATKDYLQLFSLFFWRFLTHKKATPLLRAATKRYQKPIDSKTSFDINEFLSYR